MSIAQQQNLAAEWVRSAPYGPVSVSYGPSGTSWVVGWVFANREEGEKVMCELAAEIMKRSCTA